MNNNKFIGDGANRRGKKPARLARILARVVLFLSRPLSSFIFPRSLAFKDRWEYGNTIGEMAFARRSRPRRRAGGQTINLHWAARDCSIFLFYLLLFLLSPPLIRAGGR